MNKVKIGDRVILAHPKQCRKLIKKPKRKLYVIVPNYSVNAVTGYYNKSQANKMNQSLGFSDVVEFEEETPNAKLPPGYIIDMSQFLVTNDAPCTRCKIKLPVDGDIWCRTCNQEMGCTPVGSCDCGGTIANTTHSFWCSTYKQNK